MKAKHSFASFLVAALAFAHAGSKAEQTAIVTENNLNVRGKPSFLGEVITQLQKGETVVVLEEIKSAVTRPGEPASWSRIRMPANTPVWIFAPFVDPNASTVNVSRLNIRAGPGENFSVVGRLDRGESVKPIRTVDDWMEIEPPDSAEAFVASSFLAIQKEAPSEVRAPQEPTPTAEVTEKQPTGEGSVRTEPPTESPAKRSDTAPPSAENENTAVAKETDQPVANEEPLEATPVSEQEIIRPAPALEPTDAAPVAAVAAPVILEAQPAPIIPSRPPTRRIVRREGIVRSTRSIQAPTYFELVSVDTGKAINYLKAKSEDLNLRDYKGKTIIVTGEEGIESRWPKQPILLIETLKPAP